MKRLRTLPTSFEILLSPLFQGKRAAERDRRERKGGTAVRGLMIGDVGTHTGMLRAIEPLLIEPVILHHQQITFGVTQPAGLRHTEGYLLVMEDYGFNQQGLDGTQHPRVRSDIAYHETPNGGASFAFSSIAFCGALPWNNGDNNISKLVGNVLNRFMQDRPAADATAGRDHASRSVPITTSR